MKDKWLYQVSDWIKVSIYWLKLISFRFIISSAYIRSQQISDLFKIQAAIELTNINYEKYEETSLT